MPMRARPIAKAALAVALCIAPVAAQEDPFYCAERQLGRYFYCERPKEPEGTKFDAPAAPISASEEMAGVRERLEELRAEAVLRPTEAAVRDYIVYQREQLDRASTFSDVWRRLLWTDPNLDYNLLRPVSGIAKQAWLDGRKEDRRATLAHLRDRYGLFYFYAASCSACTEFSPILRAFADTHGLTVKAVSVDGGPNPSFPDAVIDRGQMERLGLGGSPTPALVLFDTETRAVTPVAFGIVSHAELEDRIFVLTQKETGEDY